jgi:hypothetical protein
MAMSLGDGRAVVPRTERRQTCWKFLQIASSFSPVVFSKMGFQILHFTPSLHCNGIASMTFHGQRFVTAASRRCQLIVTQIFDNLFLTSRPRIEEWRE